MKKLLNILVIIAFLFSCEKNSSVMVYQNMDVTTQFVTDNALIISYRDCAGDSGTNTYLCLDSVLTDSRCPEGALCIWAGEAEVRFKFVRSDEKPVFFILHPDPSSANGTVLDGYKFTLRNLYPYPSVKHFPEQNEYRAEIFIEKEN
jgi:hypothetical protein